MKFFNMKKGNIFLCLVSVFVIFTFGCSKNDDNDIERNEIAKYTESERINKFVVNCVQKMYLWESETNWTKYNNSSTFSSYKDKEGHNALFEQFIYKDDSWSMLTDDIAKLREQFSGVTTTYGYSLVLYRFSNDNSIFAIVLFNYPGSPAELKGIKRGDIIVGINGNKITESNYEELFYSKSITLTTGRIENNVIYDNPTRISMTAIEMYENPMHKYTIIEKGSHKIGYLCYTDYMIKSEADLIQVFSEFKNEGVTDVVLDLRYNRGGYAQTAQVLSSILAPTAIAKNKNVYLSHKWNNLLASILDEDELYVYFDNTLSVSMDLKKLYVLTSANTASASEATIIGLEPYLDITLIGETTSGKYCGGLLWNPEDYYGMFPESGINKSYYSSYTNWGMYIMVYRYSNKNGFPEFITGIPPNISAKEDYFNLKPLGDATDPLLGRAIEKITGEPFVNTYSSPVDMSKYQILPELRQKRALDNKLIYNRQSLNK